MIHKQVVDNENIAAASLKNKNDILPDFRDSVRSFANIFAYCFYSNSGEMNSKDKHLFY